MENAVGGRIVENAAEVGLYALDILIDLLKNTKT